MFEFALGLSINVGVAVALIGVVVLPFWLTWRTARETDRYWASYRPDACPHCHASYGTNQGQDLCVSYLVDSDDTKSCNTSADHWQLPLGEREFHCSHCGTTALYERTKGPPIPRGDYRPEDVPHPRRCLDCNDVFSLPAYGECPICSGKRLRLEDE